MVNTKIATAGTQRQQANKQHTNETNRQRRQQQQQKQVQVTKQASFFKDSTCLKSVCFLNLAALGGSSSCYISLVAINATLDAPFFSQSSPLF
jgi:hypothetical protein